MPVTRVKGGIKVSLEGVHPFRLPDKQARAFVAACMTALNEPEPVEEPHARPVDELPFGAGLPDEVRRLAREMGIQ